MKEVIMYLLGGSFSAIIIYLILSNGGAAVNLANAGFSGASTYAKTLQGR